MELEGYRFAEPIAEGGMATVYRGEQLSLQRPVAIKVLNRQMQAHDVALEAFERESLIIARLNHPNIVHVIDKGLSANGTPYFVMEYVDGQDLSALIRSADMPPMRRVEICLQICKALAYAHKNGIIHHDVKPANILLDSEYNVKVADFGIARFSRTGKPQSAETDEVMGTLRYMAPELRDASDKANVQSDLYSLGVLMYEWFAGQLPQEGITLAETGIKLPARLVRLIDGCLHLDPSQRPRSVAYLQNQLLRLLKGSHLNATQAENARAAVDKKSFVLLDVLKDNEAGGLYLFQEKSSEEQVLVRKCHLPAEGYDTAAKLSELSHPNIVRVHGVSRNERAFIIVSDYMAGGNLEERLLQVMPVHDFLFQAEKICAALAYAHRHGVYHQHLNAGSIVFDDNDVPMVSGFGLPHLGESSLKASQYEGVRGDLFAAGLLFYRMLIGEMPRWYQDELQQGKAFMRLPAELRGVLVKLLDDKSRVCFEDFSQVSKALSDVNTQLKTLVHRPKPVPEKVDQDKKKLLLLLLLVLFFLTLLNTSVLVMFGLDSEIIQALRISLANLTTDTY
jgi:serine/threonine-protein kinase